VPLPVPADDRPRRQRPGGGRRLDQYLSVGTGNSWSVVDALKVDDTFGGAVSGLEVAPGDYDAENVTADLLLTFIAMKQNAEV
jgi:hypothetical protein